MQIFVILLFGRMAESRCPGRGTVAGDIITALTAWPLFTLIDTGRPGSPPWPCPRASNC